MLVLKSRGIDDFSGKVKITCDEIHFLASFVVAGWLSQGFRNPKSFGIQPSVEKDLELEYCFF
jgi:hypothetical protein